MTWVKRTGARVSQAVAEYETVIRERVLFSDGGDAVDKAADKIVTYADFHTNRDNWRRFYEARRKRKEAGRVLT